MRCAINQAQNEMPTLAYKLPIRIFVGLTLGKAMNFSLEVMSLFWKKEWMNNCP